MLPTPTPSGLLVAQAIIAAQGVDLSADQPYYPFENGTTLREAYNFLHLNGYILINGGRIQREVLGHTLTMWESSAPQPIDYTYVRELLECNYPYERVEAYDTDPCLPIFDQESYT